MAATFISSPLLESGGNSVLNRPYTSSPSATINTWNQYTFNLPVSSIPVGSRDSVYVIIVGSSAFGNNILIDDFSVTHYPALQTFVNAGLTYQNTSPTGKNVTNQTIVGAQIVLDGEASPFSAANLVFNTNGTTSPATDIVNARLWYSGGMDVLDTSHAQLLGTIPNPWFTNITFNGTTLVHGVNHFWVTYNIPAAATSNNFVDADFVSFDLRRTKTCTGLAGSNTITVSDTIGLYTGMTVSGTGVASNAMITGFSGPTTVTLNATNTGAVSGSVIFYSTFTPAVTTLVGSRLIDIVYCIPVRPFLCCWVSNYCSYDFVSGVRLDGDSSATKGIYTGWQPCWPLPGNPTGKFNSDPGNYGECGPFGVYPTAQCPYTRHPDDYDYFPPMPGTSTSVKSDGISEYSITAFAGTWYNSQYIAAFLDLNHDGYLGDSLLITTYTAAPGAPGALQMIPTGNLVSGSPVITLTTLPGWAGAIAIGRAIWGPGIPVGATITGWSSPNITISAPAVQSLANSKLYIGMPGGEKLFQSCGLLKGESCSAVFCLPYSNVTGPTRLRVMEVFGATNIKSCAWYAFGETEDYTLGVMPACNPTTFGGPPGYNKIWLGYTDDWHNPVNWCGGVPTVNDNVFIPPYTSGLPPGRPGLKSPVIHEGNYAESGKLRLSSGDSLVINSYLPGTLKIADSLVIENLAKFKVVNSFADSARINNGTLSSPTFYAPLRDGQQGRVFIAYTYADFVNAGMKPGDVVDTLLLHVQRQTTAFTTGYSNVTIKYSTVNASTSFLPGALGIVPPYLSGPVTVFSGSIAADGTLPGAYTTLRITLQSGLFVIPSGMQTVMLEICYDNNGAVGGGLFQFRHTQVSVGRNVFALLYGNPAAPACSMQPNDPMNPATWQVSQLRPNITFRYHRPYARYEIESRKHWVNNGAFIPGFSRVTMTGADVSGSPNVFPQSITGNASTTFYDLKINNAQHVTRKTDFTVTDSLILENGWLKLDSGTVTLTRRDSGALSRINGYLLSETAPASGLYYGNLRWNMTGASLPQTYTVPFVNSSGTPVMMTYKAESGDHDVTFATYATGPGNTPLPQESLMYPAPTVTNLNGFSTGTNNSMNMIDRYWKIYNSTPSGAQADITLRYAFSEQAATGNTNMITQRWVVNANSFTAGPGWELPLLAGQLFTPNAITVPDFTAFADNIWWVGVKEETPLPVELLEFTARPFGEKVRLNWSTLTELNNERFEVYRTEDMLIWDYITEQPGKGNSIQLQTYEDWDEAPFNGVQYYKLLQHDHSGRVQEYGPVAVDMSKRSFGILSATSSESHQVMTVVFNYDSSEPFTIQVVDMTGRVIVSKSWEEGISGAHAVTFEGPQARGVYQVILRNSSQADTRMIFY